MGIVYTTDEQIQKMRCDLKEARAKEQAMRAHKLLYALNVVARKAGQWLFYGLVTMLLIVLVSILITKSQGKIPSLFGYQMFVVESGSMSPTLNVGKVILSRAPKDPSALPMGTIITFVASDGAVITHRIIEVVKDDAGNVRYRTKGDNPINSPDAALVPAEKVIAVFVTAIPFT